MGLRLIDGDIDGGLPEYPLSRDYRMPTHYFMAWWHNRWLNSALHLKGSYEVQGVAVALYSLAQNQAPIGTLPRDDEEIAILLRMPVARWIDLCRLTISPMHGWRLVSCEGEVRWAHPVVTELVVEAQQRRDLRELSKEERAIQKRIERLRGALIELGLNEHLASDRMLLEELNEWLEENCKGRRGPMWYARALTWAQNAGHISAAAERSRT